MAFTIIDRPRSWDRIIGQDRAVRTLTSILTHSKLLPRGIILEGPSGLGKTSTAYVLAQALMCTGGSPLGCGLCPSCLQFQANPSYHPEFLMVDAASNSGNEAAKRIVEAAMDLPTLGRTRVVVVDEAHRLSQEAWDVYLAPLEMASLPCTFIFCTTEGRRIPAMIRGRCSSIRFFRVALTDLTAMLVRLATEHNIEFDMDGMRTIARACKGKVRDAVSLLEKVSNRGRVTRELVADAVDLTLPDRALSVLVHLGHGRFTDACKELEGMALSYGSGRTIEEVFSAYGRSVFGDPESTPEEESIYEGLRICFRDSAPVTSTLLKWSATDRIPSDALALFAHELSLHVTLLDAKKATPTVQTLPSATAASDPEPPAGKRKVTRDELAAALGADLAPI